MMSSERKQAIPSDVRHGQCFHPGTLSKPQRSCLKRRSQEKMSSSVHLHSPARRKETKNVTYGVAEILHYERQIGDHSSVNHGLPAVTGWKFIAVDVFTVDDYEKNRQQGQLLHRLAYVERERILQDICGYSPREVLFASGKSAKQKRMEASVCPNEKISEIKEKLRHRLHQHNSRRVAFRSLCKERDEHNIALQSTPVLLQ